MSRDVVEKNRDLIFVLEEALSAVPDAVGPEAFPLKHHFADGSYAREIFLPAGTIVVGKIHRHSHVNVISMGRVLVYTPEEGTQELAAPLTFVSKPGTKRAVHALEDTIWTTIHVTKETDLDAIEREIIAPTFKALEEG